jgi:cytidylate kinase
MVHGPPAVGKLTVAKEVVRLTGMRLLDNHATVNAVAPIFGFEHEAYFRLIRKLRLAILEEAAKAEIDLVMTMVYNAGRSEAGLTLLDDVVGQSGGNVAFLRLTCDREVLGRRVVNADRSQKQKLDSVSDLERYMAERDPDVPIPGRDSLTIDNTHLTATEVAEAAIAHYGLMRLVPQP